MCLATRRWLELLVYMQTHTTRSLADMGVLRHTRTRSSACECPLATWLLVISSSRLASLAITDTRTRELQLLMLLMSLVASRVVAAYAGILCRQTPCLEAATVRQTCGGFSLSRMLLLLGSCCAAASCVKNTRSSLRYRSWLRDLL